MGVVRVGTSGFSYPSWKGAFYPERIRPSEMLAYYAGRFGAVEVNATFRRFPTAALLARWREAVPDGFRFALKAHQRITHRKRLEDAGEEVAAFLRGASALGSRLGPVLFQLPPQLPFERHRLAGFLAALPAGGLYAVEPRHPSFADEAFFELLAEHGVALGLNDTLTDPADYRVTGPLAYLRFRGGRYAPAELEHRARVVRGLTRQVDVYVFFMHEEDPGAPLQALGFAELAGAPSPATR